MRKLLVDMQTDGRTSSDVTAQARNISSLVDRYSYMLSVIASVTQVSRRHCIY